MRELFSYDQAIAAYHTSIKIGPMPLLSWDMYMDNYGYMTSFKQDLRSLMTLTKDWAFDRDYIKELTIERAVIIITTLKLEIVYASHNMKAMNGYDTEDVMGKNPKMFQGDGTCPRVAAEIRKAVKQRKPFEEVILNYRKDKSLYHCRIKGFPVCNTSGELVNYIAFEEVA